MTPRLPLSQQVLFITGASTGIGAALAQVVALQYPGIRLILSARCQDNLESVAQICRQRGAEVRLLLADLSQTSEVLALAQEAWAAWGRIDALVNNAGYGQMGPLELITPEMAQRQLAVNFQAPLLLAQAMIPGMRSQEGGRIINISSLAGRTAFPGGGLYSCSKFALEAMSDVLRMELKGFNIGVSVIEPGPVVTEFFEGIRRSLKAEFPEADASLYAPVFENLATIDQQLAQLGWSAEKTAQVILRALGDRHPRPRYLAMTGGRIAVPLLTKWLPTTWCDRFWKKFYGLDRVEKNWKAQAQSPAFSVESP